MTKRDGDIGKISFFINNSEKEEDILKFGRPKVSGSRFVYRIPLEQYVDYFSATEPNVLKIVAYEKANAISSQGDTLLYRLSGTAKGPIRTSATPGASTAYTTSIYGIFIGVNTLGLSYAEKDAQTMHRILKKAAQLFIPDSSRGKAVFKLFSATQPESFKPSKENILRYLEELRSVIQPDDYLIFFYSGHGKAFKSSDPKDPKGGEKDDFALLLQGISEGQVLTENRLSAHVRKALNLSYRDEITPLLNALPARKRIFCIDACESGEAADLATKSSILSRERAFNNMREFTFWPVQQKIRRVAVAKVTH